jgi:hypothetical protein
MSHVYHDKIIKSEEAYKQFLDLQVEKKDLKTKPAAKFFGKTYVVQTYTKTYGKGQRFKNFCQALAATLGTLFIGLADKRIRHKWESVFTGQITKEIAVKESVFNTFTPPNVPPPPLLEGEQRQDSSSLKPSLLKKVSLQTGRGPSLKKIEITAPTQPPPRATLSADEAKLEWQALEKWITENNTAELATFLDAHLESVNACDENSNTPLMIAAQHGKIDAMNTLIDKGASIWRYNDDWNSALTYAVEEGHKEVVELLIDKGMNVDGNSKVGKPPLLDKIPLLIASAKGHSDIVELLLQRGANKECKDSHKKTALMIACEKGNLATVKTLLAHNLSTSDIDVGYQDANLVILPLSKHY